jgi:GNAT superfamily N-acetyltransferase
MELRRLTPEDAPAAAQLLGDALAGMNELPEAARRDWSLRWNAGALLVFGGQPGTQVWTAGDPGRVDGLLIASAPEAGVVTVIWVLVAPRTRSKGIGAALMHACAEQARRSGAHKIRLTVPGARARQFYRRLGMTEEGHFRRHWYGADFWQMGWWL